MKKNTALIIGIFAFSVIAFSASLNTVQAKQSALPDTVKIGFLYPATGGLGPIGGGLLDGAKAAIHRLNEENTDVTFELVSQDTATTPDTGKTVAQTLVSDGVKVIVGAAGSGITLAASEVTIPNHVPLISYSSTSPAISDLGDDDYVFRVVASDLYQGQALAQLATDKGVTKAYILNLDNAYGNGVADQFEAKFKELGGTVAGQTAYDEKASSFASEVTAAKDSGADGVIIVAYPEDANKIFAEAKTQAVAVKWFGTDGIASSSVTNNEGTADYVKDKLFGTQPSSGTASTGSKYDQYVADVASVSGSEGIFGDYAYDAVLLAGSAVVDAGEYDGVKIRDSLYKVADGFAASTGANKAFNCDGEPISQAYDYWKVNATDSSVEVETARAKDFTGLGAKATTPCGENKYVPASSPGFELYLLFSALVVVSATAIRKRK